MKFFIMFLVVVSSVFGNQLGVDGGRFVFGQISEMRRDQYLLDTQTGQVWQVLETEDKTLILSPVKVRNFVWNQKTSQMEQIIDYIPINPYSLTQGTDSKKK